MAPILTLILALRSPMDPKVQFEHKPSQPNSNAWNQIVFNQYAFDPMNDIRKTEQRTRAILDLIGQAARILAKEDPNGDICTMRTFYKDQKGNLHPQLSISERPSKTAVAGATSSIDERLLLWSARAHKENVDISSIPSGVPSAVYLGYLEALVTKAITAKAAAEIKTATELGEPPPVTDESEPDMGS